MGSILKPERGLAWGGAVAGAVLGLMAPAVTATPALAAAFDDCAAEAASQWEAGFETIGKDLSGIDTKAAIAACQKALKADDSSMQVKTLLGRTYYADSQDSKAVPLLEEAAKDGNLLALATFGDMLVMGTGIDKDMERGAGLLQEAADQGFAPAQNSLGLSYDYGDGVDQDYYQAQRWYRAAAEQGLPRAESNLGLMYQEGLGLERDYIAAAAWFVLKMGRKLPVKQFLMAAVIIVMASSIAVLGNALRALQEAAVLDLHVLRDWPHPPIFISQATGYFPTLPSVVGQLALLGVYLVGGLATWGWSRRRKALAAAAGAGTPEAPADEPALT